MDSDDVPETEGVENRRSLSPEETPIICYDIVLEIERTAKRRCVPLDAGGGGEGGSAVGGGGEGGSAVGGGGEGGSAVGGGGEGGSDVGGGGEGGSAVGGGEGGGHCKAVQFRLERLLEEDDYEEGLYDSARCAWTSNLGDDDEEAVVSSPVHKDRIHGDIGSSVHTEIQNRDLAAAKEEEGVISSYTLTSPLRKPYIPDELADPAAHPEIFAAFKQAKAQYKAKLDALNNLFPFDFIGNSEPSCLFREPRLLAIRELAKKAVLSAAKSIVRLSSSFDGKPMTSCCGLWIDWNEKSKTGKVLTTAHIIRSKHPTLNHWKGRDEYNAKADVLVHLSDGTTTEARLLYCQEHYDFAFFEVTVDLLVHLSSFNQNRVQWGQEVIRLGRDEMMNLSITHGRVEFLNPNKYERHHYMYFYHDDPNFQCKDDGGCIIGLDGTIVGLVNDHMKDSFVPSSILIMSIDLWRKFGCIPRLHLEMKFSSIKLLDPIHVDKMWRKYDIEEGLIVEEVSKESHAEKPGIQIGDIIECLNGERISSTVEILMSRCRDHFEEGNVLNDKINISLQLFDTVKLLRRTENLTVDVSDHREVVVRGTRPVTT